MALTHSDVVLSLNAHILCGNQNLTGGVFFRGTERGYMDPLTFELLQDFAREGRTGRCLISYRTPIAVEVLDKTGDFSVWLVPDIYYSAITSVHHQSKVLLLQKSARVEYIPWDATKEDVERIICAQMKYTRGKPGRYVRGHRYTEED